MPPASILDSSSFIIVEDPNRLGDLFERLDIPDFQIIRPEKATAEKSDRQNPDSFVKSILIRGKSVGSIAYLNIVMEIQQTKAGTAWTSIGLDGLVLRAVRSGNAPVAASMVRPGGPWQVRTDSTGTHRIEVELGTEITSDRSTRRFALSIPEAASTELAIEVPEQVLFATTNARDSLQTRFDSVRNLYAITGLLTPRTRLELRWLGQSLIRNEDRIRLECRGQVALRMDLDAVSTRQVWQIRPLTGLPTTLSFEIPAEETLLDILIDGQATRPSFEKAGTGNIVVQMDNPSTAKGPNSEPISVELVTRLAYPAKTVDTQASSREITWRAPRWSHGEIVTGIIAVEMPERWVHVYDPESAFEPVDPRDLSDRLRKSSNQVAFRFFGSNASHTFRIRRRRPPLFTDVRTIGIVRRSQTEYVSDIVIQGEIDPLREYEIELDRSARPLFIGPRDVWERYEFVGETVNGERKFRRLRLTPNRSLKAETSATLRIRYLRRSDSPDTFSVCLPRFVDSTGESYRTWLLPEPSVAIEPVDQTQPIRRKLPSQEASVFTNLLEQSIGDEDKWIRPRNASDANSVFFRFANPGDKEIAFRTIVRPASLDCTQVLVLRPSAEAMVIRHVFDCSIDKGNFDRIVVTPSPENPIRNLRYVLSHEGADQTGNLIIQDGGFEIPLPSDISRRFTLTLETVRAWPDGPDSGRRESDTSVSGRRFSAAKYDFSIADARLLQRQFRVVDKLDSTSSITGQSQNWLRVSRIAESNDEKVQTWNAATRETRWPEIQTLPLATRPGASGDSFVSNIHAFSNSGNNPVLSVAYRIGASVDELQLTRVQGLTIRSATFGELSVDVASTADKWIVSIPEPRSGTLILKFRSENPLTQVSIPLPAKSSGPVRIPTRFHFERSPMERVMPAWRSGWRFAEDTSLPSFDEFGVDLSASDNPSVIFATENPSSSLPIRQVPLILLLLGTFVGSVFAIGAANRIAKGSRVEIPAVALIAIAAYLASGQLGAIWAAVASCGIVFGTIAFRNSTAPANPPSRIEAQATLSKKSGRPSSESSPRSNLSPSYVSSEPSTVLKRSGSRDMIQAESPVAETSSSLDHSQSGEQDRWSLALDSSATPASSINRAEKSDSADKIS